MIEFQISHGKLCITDPCYHHGTWCAQWGIPAKNGSWFATMNGDFESLKCIAHGYSKVVETKKFDNIGVDSGQICVHDDTIYNDVVEDPYWYEQCCGVTLDATNFTRGYGSVRHGVVTSTKYGDGEYDAIVKYDKNGEAVEVEVFLNGPFKEEDEEDEDY